MSGSIQFFNPDPNILYKALSGTGVQEGRRNDLLNQSTQQALGAGEAEMMARASTALLDPARYPDEASRAAAYPGAVAELQRYGFAKNVPSTYPGEAALRRVAALAVPAEKQYDRQGVATELAGIRGGLTGATPGTATGGGQPAPPGAYGQGGRGSSITVPPEYMPFYQEASQRTGIPVEVLIAQHRQESGFNPNATGAAGEIGIGQIKPSTARDPGYGMAGVDPATLRDPRANINFAADYLKARGGGGNWADPEHQRRALQNYNGGGDPNYVANVTRYMPAGYGGAPATQTAAAPASPAQRVTTSDPETGLPVVTGGPPAAPVAPAGGGRVQVASITPTTMTDATPAPVATPGTPPAATTQQPPPPPAPRPAEMPPELRTRRGGIADGLTESDIAEFAQRPATTRAEVQALRTDMEQKRQYNRQAQRDWQTQETAAQNAAALATQREVENRDRTARLQLDVNRFNADRVKEAKEVAPTLDEIAPLIYADTATDAQRRSYSRAMETGFLKPHMELINGAQVLVPGRIPAGYPAWDYHPPKPGDDQAAKPPQSESEKPKVISEAPPKEQPPKVNDALLEDAAGIRKIDQALDGLAKHESAVGPVYHIPLSQTIGDWRAPDSAGVRAVIADIGSLKLHDRSGAAIGVKEWPRLQPFIPSVTDTPSVIREKLASFQREYLGILKDTYQIYGPESGYRKLQPVEEALTRQRSQPEKQTVKPPPPGFEVHE